jgi:hypothetical protein
VEEHSIFVGSQHTTWLGDGDVIFAAKISEHNGRPGVHKPLEGSQHRIPFILVSPKLEEVWPDANPIAAAMKSRRIIIVALLYYVC